MKTRPSRTPIEELSRHAESMIPGTLNGRVGEARPIFESESVTISSTVDENELAEPTVQFWQDRFVVVTPGTQTVNLTHLPLDNSEHLYWGRLYQRSAFWTRNAGSQTFKVLDPNAEMQVGDILTVEYAHIPGVLGEIDPPILGAVYLLHPRGTVNGAGDAEGQSFDSSIWRDGSDSTTRVVQSDQRWLVQIDQLPEEIGPIINIEFLYRGEKAFTFGEGYLSFAHYRDSAITDLLIQSEINSSPAPDASGYGDITVPYDAAVTDPLDQVATFLKLSNNGWLEVVHHGTTSLNISEISVRVTTGSA